MKEHLLTGQDALNKTEIVALVNKQIERKLVGRIQLKPGMKLFQLSPDDLMITKVTDFEDQTAKFQTPPKAPKGYMKLTPSIEPNVKRFNLVDGYLYVVALNAQNARRKFLKMLSR
jgi:hypothetical protein